MNQNRDADNRSRNAADLYWLAFLLTGRRDISIDIAADAAASLDHANPFFESWMKAWARRMVVAKALAKVRDELAASARRIQQARVQRPAAISSDPRLGGDMSKARLEEALLAIDIFPRAAVILSIFEGVRIADAVPLLDAGAALIKKAQAIGLRQFTTNLATRRTGKATGFAPVLAPAH
ncbi:MAG TPA: hypothetical protein VMH28_10280 [Candidatus Acidoferrales bacterium]|nr:hypothetical protein [Candidatus Acidoferrales bacterium]